MKRMYWIFLILFLLIIFALGYYFSIEKNCKFGNADGCNISCKIDADCKFETGYCVNINERVYLPRNLFPAYEVLTCRCESNKCVGNYTGMAAI